MSELTEIVEAACDVLRKHGEYPMQIALGEVVIGIEELEAALLLFPPGSEKVIEQTYAEFENRITELEAELALHEPDE